MCYADAPPTPTAPVAPPPTTPTWPTPPAPVPSPVAQPSTPSPEACCTRDFKNCNEQLEGWCSESKQNCEGACNKFWLPNGPVTGCTARYEPCSMDSECCGNGMQTCQGGMCELSKTPVQPVTTPPVTSPVTPPTSPTPPAPTPTPPAPTPTPPAPTPTPPAPTTPSNCPNADEMEMNIEIKGDANSGKDKNKWTLQRYDGTAKNFEDLVFSKKIGKKKPTKWNKCVPKDDCYILHLLDKNGNGIPTGHYKVEFGDISIDDKFANGDMLVEMINCGCNS